MTRLKMTQNDNKYLYNYSIDGHENLVNKSGPKKIQK